MIFANLLFAVLSYGPASHAFLWSTPWGLFCETPFLNDRPFFEDGWVLYQLDSNSDVGPERTRQMHDISIAYIAPAMKAACGVKTDSGAHFPGAADAACKKGCVELNSPRSTGKLEWSIRQMLCKADCGRGTGALGGMDLGYGIKR